MTDAFVDTSGWVALADVSEVDHHRVHQALEERQGNLATSDHILQETWSLLNRRFGWRGADDYVTAIRRGIARIEVSLLADLEVATAIGRAFPDQGFSLADRTCWAIMERLGINDAVSLDRDFRVYRYGTGKRKAFRVFP